MRERLRLWFMPRLDEIGLVMRWVIFLELCYLVVLAGLFVGKWASPTRPTDYHRNTHIILEQG